jgi:hypothetical protein
MLGVVALMVAISIWAWQRSLGAAVLPSAWVWVLSLVSITWSYTVLAMFVNKTALSVRDGMLSVRSGPLPFPNLTKNQSEQIARIKRLYWARSEAHAERFDVQALLVDGNVSILLRAVPQPQAEYVDQQLKRAIGMSDKEVLATTDSHVHIVDRGKAMPKASSLGMRKLILPLVIAAPIAYFVGWPVARDGYIASRGVDATAKILAVRDTGSQFNHMPVLEFRLEVHPTDGTAAFEASADSPISLVKLPKMTPGAEIHVKYLPNRRSWLSIEE